MLRLDVLRALRSEDTMEALLTDLTKRIERIPPELMSARQSVRRAIDQFRQHIAWLLSAARPPSQPFPLLAVYGEQGSAKSTTTNLLRNVIDPNGAPLRAAPGSERICGNQ